jgi:hypothetical protein
MFLDVLGPVEIFARTLFRRIEAPYGDSLVMKPEDLLVGRVLVSPCAGETKRVRQCSKILVSVASCGEIEMNWDEVRCEPASIS